MVGKYEYITKTAAALKRYLRVLAISCLILLIGVFNITLYPPMHSSAAGTHMLLLWDPAYGTLPTGWSIITTYNGLFPRGEAPANFGLTGGAGTPRTPTVQTVTVSAPDAADVFTGLGNALSIASGSHTHPAPTVTVGADSNGDIPAFRSLQLMQYDAGVPNSIPAGAICMFDTTAGIPSGFTQVTAQNNQMIRVDSTVTTGGNDMATNSVSATALTASTDPAGQANNTSNQAVATYAHGHTAASGTTAAVSTLPPYVQPLLAQANATTSTLVIAMTSMFDGDPGAGWAIQSNAGGNYYQQFLRPAATTANLVSAGSATHTPTTLALTSGLSNVASTSNTKLNGGGSGAAGQSHTHTITIAFNSVSSLPPYFNVVIAQKISFTQQAYRWYVDSNSENVTDPWPTGTLDTAQNTAIPAIPVAYQPPDNGTSLRLRTQILVSGQPLPANTVTYKLQYKQGSDGVCTTGTWADVDAFGGTGLWTYGSNSVVDGTQLTLSQLTPASSVLERFHRSASSGNNTNAVAVGQTFEDDFLIKNNTAAPGSQYSFRVVESTGTLLSVYSQCASLITKPNVSQELRHGEFFQDGYDQGFAWAD